MDKPTTHSLLSRITLFFKPPTIIFFTIMTYLHILFILFTINHKHLFTINNEIHEYNTRNNNNLHPSLSKLTKFKNGPYIMGIKVFNHLPQFLKASVHNPKQFRSSLKRFLYHHHFYSMEEYYEYKENVLWNWYITFNLLLMSISNVNPTLCCHYHMFTWMN
jgi:hypothetical protein